MQFSGAALKTRLQPGFEGAIDRTLAAAQSSNPPAACRTFPQALFRPPHI